jgi:hypothetical protein
MPVQSVVLSTSWTGTVVTGQIDPTDGLPRSLTVDNTTSTWNMDYWVLYLGVVQHGTVLAGTTQTFNFSNSIKEADLGYVSVSFWR